MIKEYKTGKQWHTLECCPGPHINCGCPLCSNVYVEDFRPVYDTPDNIKVKYGQLMAEKMEFDAQHLARLNELRDLCQHAEYEIMYYSWRVGSMMPMRFCKACGKPMGQPSDEEVVKFKMDELEETRKTWAKNYPNLPFPKEIEQQYDFYLRTTSGEVSQTVRSDERND